jgi:hypothetical protein
MTVRRAALLDALSADLEWLRNHPSYRNPGLNESDMAIFSEAVERARQGVLFKTVLSRLAMEADKSRTLYEHRNDPGARKTTSLIPTRKA